jgi:leader peptidase (prepilin peptidase) / N-methyltransferase
VRADPNIVAAVVVAPFVGSFLANAVVRLPKGEPLMWGRSKCPACGAALGPRDLVPVLSWVLQRGRCRHCGGRIGPVYPVIEIAAVIVAGWAATRVGGWILWASCALGWTLLVLAAIDFRTYRLPNSLTLPLAAGGLIVAALVDRSILPDHLIGAAAGALSFAAIAALYRRVRGREGLGLGDAKLVGAAGAWVSWTGLPGVVLWACASAFALLLARSLRGEAITLTTRFPFGPHLCIGIWLVWLYGPIEFGAGW